MKRLLIVSPHFPPINAPDHQRVRMALPFFSEFGWDAQVLAVSPKYVNAKLDALLEESLPENISVTRTKALPESLTRYMGLGNLGWRSLFHIREAGSRLIRSERPDLVYFSTTMFRVLTLGPLWKRKFGVPYIVDYQDPWRSRYYSRTGIHSRRPGGTLKYGFASLVARMLEPRVIREASGVTAVSPAYIEMLQEHYPGLRDTSFLLLPFSANESDFDFVNARSVTQEIFDPADGKEHWVYLGRAADDMHFALRALFSALTHLRKSNPQRWESVRLHFVGSSYAPSGQSECAVLPLAREFGLEDLVSEHPERVPYFAGLKLLCDASRILIVGSDDKDYSPSKTYQSLTARKPLLAIVHDQSLARQVLTKYSNAQVVTFKSSDRNSLSQELSHVLTVFAAGAQSLALDPAFFENHSARSMTRMLCSFFDQRVS